MKRTIRKGCFETNSSSMHSIVVTKNQGNSPVEDSFDYYKQNGKNTCPIFDSETMFGWGFGMLSTIDAKAKYAFAEFCFDQDMVDRISDIFFKNIGVYPEWPTIMEDVFRIAETDERVPWYDVKWIDDPEDPMSEICVLKSELEEGKTSDFTELEWKRVERYSADIDHESSGMLRGFLKDNNISLEDFITKARYVVIVDNDNSCYFDGVLKSGLLDMEKIESWYPGKGVSYSSYLWGKGHNSEENS